MNAILTIAEAAERMKVSRQRMHVLIQSYNLQTQKINGRLLVLHEGELKKIPKDRKKRSDSGCGSAKLDAMIEVQEKAGMQMRALRSLIEEYLKESEVSKTDLAERAGVNRQILYRILSGTYHSSPSFDFVCRLCVAMEKKLEIG